mgnify:CR=1 FL=1|tara:strand:- start:288 stop:599 length:312 start_codon:yes stop_codon:yes gene_type:complete
MGYVYPDFVFFNFDISAIIYTCIRNCGFNLPHKAMTTDNKQSPERMKQIQRSVKKHRSSHDRLEVYIPKGWRAELKEQNSKDGITTSDWIRSIIAQKIGKHQD